MAEKKIEKKVAKAPAAPKAAPAVKAAAPKAVAEKKVSVKSAAPKAAPVAKAVAPKAAPVAAKAAPKAEAPAAKPAAPAAKSSSALKVVELRCYSPASGLVEVAGDFNDWTPSKCAMKKDVHGYWTVKIKLAAGRYQYKMVFDGTSWELDPNAPAVGTEFGLNNLLEVK